MIYSIGSGSGCAVVKGCCQHRAYGTLVLFFSESFSSCALFQGYDRTTRKSTFVVPQAVRCWLSFYCTLYQKAISQLLAKPAGLLTVSEFYFCTACWLLSIRLFKD